MVAPPGIASCPNRTQQAVQPGCRLYEKKGIFSPPAVDGKTPVSSLVALDGRSVAKSRLKTNCGNVCIADRVVVVPTVDLHRMTDRQIRARHAERQ
jgi:hypothetical protein